LCSLVAYGSNGGKCVRARTTTGILSLQALSKIMKSRYISKYTKLKIYTTMTKPVVFYGRET
jgi:hypothetical protein